MLLSVGDKLDLYQILGWCHYGGRHPASCLYKEDEKRKILQAVFDYYVTRMQQWSDDTVSSGLTEAVAKGKGPGFGHEHVAGKASELQTTLQTAQTELLYDLMRVAPLLKNESFAE